ncbi:MAG: hypothetical protein ACLQU1_20540 [Bryobacteraceae bacterium]
MLQLAKGYPGGISSLVPILAALLLTASAARGQSVEIYSEFQRPDPFGGIVAPDRALAPREILSPALARGAHTVFHVAVSIPPKESYLLYVIPNPLNACLVALYKEHFDKTAAGWIADRLEELHRLPDFGVMPDPDDLVEGQTTRVYLLDLWIPPEAPEGRFRLEVQLKMGDWVVRPMELRVVEARVPAIPAGQARPLPPVEQGADAVALGTLADYLAGAGVGGGEPPVNVRGMIRRGTVQDMALAAALPKEVAGPAAIERREFDLLRANLAFTPRVFGAEWYLRIRDFLYAQWKSP